VTRSALTAAREAGADPVAEGRVRPTRQSGGAVAGRTVGALAAREGLLLLRHPGIWVGALLTLLGYVLFSSQAGGSVALQDGGLPLMLLAWTTLIVVNLAALRSRRDGTGELFDSLPTPAAARTAGHLVSVVAVVPLAMAFLVGWYLVWRASPAAVGRPGSAAQVAGVLLLVIGAGVSGVLLARWVPHPLGGPLGVIAIIVLQVNFGYQDDRWRWLHFAPGDAYKSAFDIRHDGWHVAYLCGLVLLGAVLALSRHGIRRRLMVAGATAVVVLATSGWVQTRPPSVGRLASMAAQLENPQAHQVCEDRDGVRYCAYRGYQQWIPRWEPPVRGVLARLPASRRAGMVEVRQRPIPDVERNLLPALRVRIDPHRVWAADGTVHPGLDWYVHDHQLGLGFQVAARAVGLPPAVAWPGLACSAGGQARIVVALWLAGRATPAAGDVLRKRATRVEQEGTAALASLRALDVVPDYGPQDKFPDSDFLPEVGATGRGADLVAAVRLMDRSDDRMASMLTDHWDRLTDPATPVSTLFELARVPIPVGIADLPPVSPGVGRSCA